VVTGSKCNTHKPPEERVKAVVATVCGIVQQPVRDAVHPNLDRFTVEEQIQQLTDRRNVLLSELIAANQNIKGLKLAIRDGYEGSKPLRYTKLDKKRKRAEGSGTLVDAESSKKTISTEVEAEVEAELPVADTVMHGKLMVNIPALLPQDRGAMESSAEVPHIPGLHVYDSNMQLVGGPALPSEMIVFEAE